MTVVYIDMLFLLNLIANYLLLLAEGRMYGAPLCRWRIGFAAAAGALYAALIFLPGLGWLAHWLCKLAAGVLMALIAYGGERELARITVLFLYPVTSVIVCRSSTGDAANIRACCQ